MVFKKKINKPVVEEKKVKASIKALSPVKKTTPLKKNLKDEEESSPVMEEFPLIREGVVRIPFFEKKPGIKKSDGSLRIQTAEGWKRMMKKNLKALKT